MASSTPQIDDEITSLATTIHQTIPITPLAQIRERLQICQSWFGSVSHARTRLSNTLILELGCGQGDTTVTLSGLLRDSTTPPDSQILAVDPGALDYGAPITLGEAQAQISQTSLGGRIQFIQAESIEYITQLGREGRVPDVVILAHSLFYLPSETYLLDLLSTLREVSVAAGNEITLLLAEWGMRASQPAAEAHVFAVKTLAAQKVPEGNIQTLFYPERIGEIANEAGWSLEREGYFVPEEDVDDGWWEVASAKENGKEGWRDEVKKLEEMEKAAEGKLRSMDVWCSVWKV